MAGIPLSSGFNVSAGIPLDLRTTVADITERDNIPTIGRYPGLLVFVESESKYYYLKTGITNSDWAELSGFVSHTHVKADITDFTHTHLKSDITDFAHTHIKSDITDFTHTHSIPDVTGLQTALDNKVDTSEVVTTATANKILKLDSNAKLPASITGDSDTVDGYHASAFALSSHTHTISQITDFAHTHSISEITNLQSSLDAKVNTSDVVITATANKILKLDANAKLPASITGNADGNAATATKLQTARTISLSGDVTGSASFDGSVNAAISTALSNTGVAAGTYTKLTVDSKGRATAGTNLSASDLPTHNHTKSQITDFSHTHIISDVTNLQTSLDSKVNTSDVVTVATANKILKLDSNAKLPASITDNAATATKLETARTITIGGSAKGFDGSANVSFTLGEIGAAATSHTHTPSAVGLGNVTNDAQLKRSGNDWLGFGSKSYINFNTNDRFLIEDYDSSYVKKYTTLSDIKSWISNNITVLNALSLKYDTPEQPWGVFDYFNPVFNNGKAYLTTVNNVPTLTDYATKLATARTINGTSFDGSANITTSSWGTSRTITIGSTGKSVDGSANVSWSLAEIGAAASSHTHSNYTPFASNSQTIPKNTPSGTWYRIATSVSGVGRNDGIFELEYSGGGYHQRVSFRASSMYNSDNSIQIVKMGGSKFINDNNFVIQSVRVVYYPNTYSSKYAYVEVFVANPNTTNNATLNVRLVNAIGWGLTTGAGSIPTNYATKDLSLKNYNPFYNTNDKRNVISSSSGTLNIDLRLSNNETVVSNIIQNTTININGLYDGAAGTILLYLDGTYTITLGTMTNDVGNAVNKHTSGTFSSLAAGYYIIGYRVLPDASGTWRVFINISSKYN